MPVPHPVHSPRAKPSTHQSIVRIMEQEEARLYRSSWWLRERGYAQRVCALCLCLLWVIPISCAVRGQPGDAAAALFFGLVINGLQLTLLILAHRNIHKSRIQHVLERFGVTPGDQA